MADPVTANTHDDVPVEKKLDELHALIDGIDVAMLTTRTEDGDLNARPMALQSRTDGADLRLMTNAHSRKVAEISTHAHVNLAFVKPGSREWVSISGTATLTQDRSTIRELYRPDWKAWFEDEGGAHDGGPADPRIMLINVAAHHVTYFKLNEPRPIVLFKIARAAVSKSVPIVGDIRHLEPDDLRP